MYADFHDGAGEAPQQLNTGQKAWCALMLAVTLGSAVVTAMFLQRELHPVGEPVVTLDLEDIAPRPGFDLSR